MVDDVYYTESKVLGISVIKKSEFIPALYDVVVAIGDPWDRKRFVESMPFETTWATIIHPTAIISKWVEIGEGSIITAGTILTCDIKVGKHAHLNLQTTITHDCEIGDYFTAGPAVHISGNCKIGDCVNIGTTAALRNGISICNNVTIGMGSVVVKNITEEGIYVGNPAKKLVKS
jgi:sugar O-acyltransferase (sialic acid O-acetyltransferase NeuD family)